MKEFFLGALNNRPDQKGIFEHFKAIAEATELNIYNIPYRTGRNIENEALYKLAEFSNIIGVKDSSGNIAQTMALITHKPDGSPDRRGSFVLCESGFGRRWWNSCIISLRDRKIWFYTK